MIKPAVTIFTMVMIVGFGAGSVGAANPMSDKEAKPTLGERFTKGTIKGTLMKMDGEYIWIKDTDGKESRVHIDKSTKLDTVVVGDSVKAYVTDQGHTTTLQRDE